MANARRMLVDKVLEFIDHYADSGDVSREALAEQIVDAITIPSENGKVRYPYLTVAPPTE